MLRLGADDEERSGGLRSSTVKSRRARAARRVLGLYVRDDQPPDPEHQDAWVGHTSGKRGT